MTEQWERNFGPNSTSEAIVNKLMKEPEVEEMDRNKLKSWLQTFKEESNLDHVDLMQLRDYFQFQTNFNTPNKQLHFKFLDITWELAEQVGVRI